MTVYKIKTITKSLLLAAALVSFSSHAACQDRQDDPKYGTIKVRKPIPVEFFVEIDYIPEYVSGNLLDDLYQHVQFPENSDLDVAKVWVNVIISDHGDVIWAEAEKGTPVEFSPNAEEAVRKLRRFVAHEEQDLKVPARFKLSINYKRS